MMRTLLISGASRGIGNSIAKKALSDGHRISLGIRNKKELEGTVLDPNVSGHDKILHCNYEAIKPYTAKDWVDQTVGRFGGFDTVINCAGVFSKTRFLFEDNEEKDIEYTWKVNVMGPWHLTKASWGELSKSKKGRVIFLVSLSGKRSKGNLASYSMSKFALMGLCQTIRNEAWNEGIRLTAICPSWVNTDMASNVKSMPKEKMTQPCDIAALCSELLVLPNSCIPFELCLNCNLES